MKWHELHERLINLMINAHKKNIPFIPSFIQKFNRIIFASDIPYTVKIGKGTKFIHNGLGVVVHSNSVIGDNCRIYHNVTIGGRHDRGCPTIGDNVFIGAGACILGGIHIGNGSKVGANSVVIKDVQPNSVVGGIPAVSLK